MPASDPAWTSGEAVGGELTHRRLRYGDLIAYKRREHEARHQDLDKLVRQAQKLGLGY